MVPPVLASERAIAKQTGHRSVAVLRGYIEDATVFEDARGLLVT